MCLHAYVCIQQDAYAMMRLWRSEDSLGKMGLTSYHVPMQFWVRSGFEGGSEGRK